MPCTECPYKGSKIVKNLGLKNTEVMFVGEAPGKEEVQEGVPFIGKSGKLLRSMIEAVGINKTSRISVANSVRCWIDNGDKKKVTEGMSHCRSFLESFIKETKPKLIVTLGDVALRQVISMKQIMRNRGQFFKSEEFGCDVFVTVHPAYILRGMQKGYPNIRFDEMSSSEKLYLSDFKLIEEYRKTEVAPNQIDTSGYSEVKEKGIEKFLKSKYVAIDYETNTLDVRSKEAKLLSVSLSNRKGKAKVYLFRKNQAPESLKKVLENNSITKLVAARPFEEIVSRKLLGIEVKGNVVDVLTMAHVLDENSYEYNLESVVNTYTNMRNIKQLAKGQRDSLENLQKKDLINYNGCDADATFQAFTAMKSLMDNDLIRYYTKYIIPIQNALSDVSKHGCLIDIEVLRRNQLRAVRLARQAASRCWSRVPEIIQKKYADDLNLNRSSIIEDLLFLHKDGFNLKPKIFTEKTGRPSTSSEHLNMFSNPFIKDYKDYKSISKIKSTYIDNLFGFIKEDGRVYPNAILTRQVTGRISTLDPPIIIYPQRGKYVDLIREAVVADEGWVMGARDLDTSEMRIMGWLANDRSILNALDKGIDLHTATASSVMWKVDINKVTDEMRQGAKPVNFGFIFGMSAEGYVHYLWNDYNTVISLKDARDIRRAYFAKYKNIPFYYEEVLKEARSRGYVRGVLGRKRHLPEMKSMPVRYASDFIGDGVYLRETEKQAINYKIQNFSTELGVLGLALFQQEINANSKLKNSARIYWFIHDNVMFQAKDDVFGYAMETIKDCMENRTKEYIKKNFNVNVNYPIASSGKSGESWASLKKYK